MTPEASFATALKTCYPVVKGQDSEKKGLLIYKDRKWKFAPKKLQSEYFYNTLIQTLTLNPKKFSELKLPEAIVIRWVNDFNSAMTSKKFEDKEIKAVSKIPAKVQFSSNNKYAWLSNFFNTLIYDNEQKRFYPRVENGYAFFKLRKGSKESIDETKVIEVVQNMDPKAVKSSSKDFWKRKSEEDSEAAVKEMSRLVQLKFVQNPCLATLLKKFPLTTTFEEFTGDDFWGSALGSMTGEKSNQMGKIIEITRKAIA